MCLEEFNLYISLYSNNLGKKKIIEKIELIKKSINLNF